MPHDSRLKSSFALADRQIGHGQPVFIIAEIGVNHNGDLQLAKDMVAAAAACGADCVKFQTFRADEFMADKKLIYEYESAGQRVRESMYDMFKRLELPLAWHQELFATARQLGVCPLTSVAYPLSADLVTDIGVAGYKLSSEDLINLPLVEHVAQKGKPILFSTGMSDAEEVADVVAILQKYHANEWVFLHCVSLYPTPDKEANLRRMRTLAEAVQGPVGYSDHTVGITACLGAVALGACVLEKHFTTDKNLAGPDHALSANPEEFRALVQSVRRLEAQLGSSQLAPSQTELVQRQEFRRSIVASQDLAEGHVITTDDLALKRPGYGLRARDMPSLVGKKLQHAVHKDDVIQHNDVK